MADQNSSPGVTAGMLTGEEMCRDLRCGMPTLRKREKEGMPVMRVGVQRFYDPVAVKAWFMARSAPKGSAA